METGIVNSLVELSRVLELSVQEHPDAAVAIGSGIVAFCLLLLLIAVRSVRHARGQVVALRATIEGLEARIEEILKSRTSAEDVIPAGGQQPVEAFEEAPPEAPQVISPADTRGISSGGTETPQSSALDTVSASQSIDLVEAPIETAISRGLRKSRAGFISRLTSFFSGHAAVDVATLEELEEALILSDVGARCASDLVAEVRETAQETKGGITPSDLTRLLKAGICKHLIPVSETHQMYQPTSTPLIVLVVGVNGVGKTTTVAKLATKYMQQGKKVLAVAADTFRAAAVEQLAEWSNRVGFTLVRGSEGAKPSAVVFDGMVAAKDGGFDVVLIDTAGRLHTKSNLMQELEGVRNSIRRHFPEGPHETVLVLDGVSGQNALSQAREFNQAVSLTGIVVTKLDGTPKGGIIVAISQELSLPVFFIGVGEKVEDLIVFKPEAFVDALFEEDVRLPSVQHEVVPQVSNH